MLNNDLELFVASLSFGSKIVFKKVIAKTKEAAIDTVLDTYSSSSLLSILSLTELDELMASCKNETEGFYVLVFNTDKSSLIQKEIFEKCSLEEIQFKYSKVNSVIYSVKELEESLALIYAWLESDQSEPLFIEEEDN